MFNFPKGFYSDVRIAKEFSTLISYTMGKLEQQRIRDHSAAFVRLFNGKRWYYASLTDINEIQKKLDHLASMAQSLSEIDEHPVVQKMQINKDEKMLFKNDCVKNVPIREKKKMVEGNFHFFSDHKAINFFKCHYIDSYLEKEFYSSKGTELHFDRQKVGAHYFFRMVDGEKNFQDSIQSASNSFSKIPEGLSIDEKLRISEEFLKNSVPVEPGKYKVILSPEAAGIFAHESFGHKSEADFMLGDETMKKEWAIGKKVGPEILSIIDDGSISGTGYTPYDDEGTKAHKTYLIERGILAGRLHNAVTASYLEEEPTGNGRSIGFEFDPIVRMTSTFIDAGNLTKDELFQKGGNCIFIDSVKHGSGMSTFTIAPSRAYMVKDGKIGQPVNVSVISGDVFTTLGRISGVSDTVKIFSFVLGGCGKFEQYPLDVGLGGPFVLVDEMNVQ